MFKYQIEDNGKKYLVESETKLSNDEAINAVFGNNQQKESTVNKAGWDSNQNLLFNLLDQAQRGGYGVVGALEAATSPAEEQANIGEAFVKGLTLQDKKYGTDVMKNIFGKAETMPGKIAQAGGGLALDILADPTTYIAAPLVAGGKAVKSTVKAGELLSQLKKGEQLADTGRGLSFMGKTITGAEKIIEPFVAKPLRKAGMYLRDEAPIISDVLDKFTLFSNTLRPKGFDPVAWNTIVNATAKARSAEKYLLQESIDRGTLIAKELKDKGYSPEDIDNLLNSVELDKLEQAGEVGRKIKEQIDFFTGVRKNLANKNMAMIEDRDGIKYVLHLNEDKAAKKAGFNAKKQFSMADQSNYMRTWRKYGDSVVNTTSGGVYKDGIMQEILPKAKVQGLLDAGQLTDASIMEINKNTGKKIFSTDIPKLIAVQGMRTAKLKGADEFFNHVKGLELSPGEIDDFIKTGRDFAETKVPELAGKIFPKEVADHIDRQIQMFNKPDEIINMFDKAVNLWKGTATYMNIPFHARNFISNIWQNSLAGVRNPKDYAEAFQIMTNGKGLTEAQKDVLEAYKKQGLLHTGIMSGDIGQSITESINHLGDELKKSKLNIINPATYTKAWWRKGQQAGQAVETYAKLAHFNNKYNELLRAGFNKEDAAFEAGQSVKKYLFDYTDLTDSEKKIMKRIFPFYCVPDNSLILTKDGFKSCYDIKEGDSIISYNIEKDCLEDDTIKSVNIFDCNQKILSIKNKKKINLLCSHEHKWVTEKRERQTVHSYGTYSYPKETKLKQAMDLNTLDRIITSSKYLKESSSLTVEDARLLGWILTDGYYRIIDNSIEAVIYQHPKKFLEEVKVIAGGIPRKPHPINGTVCVPVLKEKIDRIKKYLINRNKRDNDWIDVLFSMSTECLEAMFDAMYKADGSVTVPKTEAGFFAESSKPGVSRTFEVLCVLLGKKFSKNNKGYYLSNNPIIDIKCCKIEEVDYNGKIWCPQTKNQTWIMKQGDTVTITGNTWSRFNIPLQIETLLKSPARATKLIKMRNDAEVITGEDNTEGLVDDWIKNASPIFVGKSKDGKSRYITLNGFVPTADLGRMGDVKDMMNQLNPLLKAAGEEGFNYNFFYGKPITRQKGLAGIVPGIGYGEKDLMLTKVPGRLEHLARLFRPLNELDKLFGRKGEELTNVGKIMTGLIGSKVYEQDQTKLYKAFNARSEDEQNAVKKNIKDLYLYLNEHPEREKQIMNEIQMLSDALYKIREKRQKGLEKFFQ